MKCDTQWEKIRGCRHTPATALLNEKKKSRIQIVMACFHPIPQSWGNSWRDFLAQHPPEPGELVTPSSGLHLNHRVLTFCTSGVWFVKIAKKMRRREGEIRYMRVMQ